MPNIKVNLVNIRFILRMNLTLLWAIQRKHEISSMNFLKRKNAQKKNYVKRVTANDIAETNPNDIVSTSVRTSLVLGNFS